MWHYCHPLGVQVQDDLHHRSPARQVVGQFRGQGRLWQDRTGAERQGDAGYALLALRVAGTRSWRETLGKSLEVPHRPQGLRGRPRRPAPGRAGVRARRTEWRSGDRDGAGAAAAAATMHLAGDPRVHAPSCRPLQPETGRAPERQGAVGRRPPEAACDHRPERGDGGADREAEDRGRRGEIQSQPGALRRFARHQPDRAEGNPGAQGLSPQLGRCQLGQDERSPSRRQSQHAGSCVASGIGRGCSSCTAPSLMQAQPAEPLIDLVPKQIPGVYHPSDISVTGFPTRSK